MGIRACEPDLVHRLLRGTSPKFERMGHRYRQELHHGRCSRCWRGGRSSTAVPTTIFGTGLSLAKTILNLPSDYNPGVYLSHWLAAGVMVVCFALMAAFLHRGTRGVLCSNFRWRIVHGLRRIALHEGLCAKDANLCRKRRCKAIHNPVDCWPCAANLHATEQEFRPTMRMISSSR